MSAGKADLQCLKPQLLAVRERFPDEVKVKTGKTKEAPLPIVVKRVIERPAIAAHWDLEELPLALSIDNIAGTDGIVVHVTVKIEGLPPRSVLRLLMSGICVLLCIPRWTPGVIWVDLA